MDDREAAPSAGNGGDAPDTAGAALARRAFELGLAVTRSDGSRRAIPVGAEPVVLDGPAISRRAALARRLVSATAKTARIVVAGPGRIEWLDAMRPVERSLVERTWRSLDRLATARVDFSTQGADVAALEVNATIPAMQGYSDIAAQAWIEAAGARAGLPPSRIASLVARNGSNSAALLAALAALHAAHRPGQPLRTIALLCRRGDSQITELEWLRACFEAAGHEAAIVHPDEVTGADPFTARGVEWQLVYRHLFASRLDDEPAPLVEQAIANWHRGASLLVNPPAAHLEMKATFARLSELGSDEASARDAGLDDGELEAIRTSVPWTRLLRAAPVAMPDGTRADDLAAAVAADPHGFVVKQSWSYGGTGVFVGSEAGTGDFRARLARSFGGDVADWAALCDYAVRRGGYVVQRAAPTDSRTMSLHTPDAHVRGEMRVDYAAYASLGVDAGGWGGVVRAAPSAIVNIVGGGGVVPLVRREVADALARATRARDA